MKIMSETEASNVRDPDPDFTAGPFVTHHDSVQQLIDTISGLYLEAENEAEEVSYATEWLPP